jgi:hypothetical protein
MAEGSQAEVPGDNRAGQGDSLAGLAGSLAEGTAVVGMVVVGSPAVVQGDNQVAPGDSRAGLAGNRAEGMVEVGTVAAGIRAGAQRPLWRVSSSRRASATPAWIAASTAVEDDMVVVQMNSAGTSVTSQANAESIRQT